MNLNIPLDFSSRLSAWTRHITLGVLAGLARDNIFLCSHLTGIAESGDVLLMCDFGKMIDILDIKINETELNGQVQGAIKQRCALKMIQGSLPLDNQTSDARAPTACTVSRQGRNGRLLVKYQCLQTSLKVSGQQQHALLRKRLLVLKKNRDSIPNYFLLFPRKRKQKSN